MTTPSRSDHAEALADTRPGLSVAGARSTACMRCGGPIGPVSYRVRVETHVADGHAVQRYAGMAAAFGAGLASALGDVGAVTRVVRDVDAHVCGGCAMDVSVVEVAAREEDGAC